MAKLPPGSAYPYVSVLYGTDSKATLAGLLVSPTITLIPMLRMELLGPAANGQVIVGNGKRKQYIRVTKWSDP
jgi:hypothetical protein